MKNLTNKEIIFMLEKCEGDAPNEKSCDYCPLAAECLHFYTGENCGSALEKED